ncbi:MAG: hypothetical protein A2075_12180 [Geobacteraceae bacterium GWC2_58_44]|nr:MAG: hypothetical protein A2075_12180 [Geobacteraceae bacterium GWC2_58_44]HBG06320.1 hypothetical protein [Geobacter sp.]
MAKKIKMLKPGTFKDMKGVVVNLSEADLQASAAAYDPALYAAPMVIGHPEANHPAYGKIGGIDFSEGFLNGDPAIHDSNFERIVNGGYYDRVSLSLFSPTAPSNPKPGVWYPRHLGFLGAMAPAVPGLGTVSLAAEEEGVVSLSVNLGDWNDRTIARMFRNVKNFLIDKFSKEEADQVLNEWDLEQITEDALRPEPAPSTVETSFAEGEGEAMDAKQKEELERREAAVTKGEVELKTKQKEKGHGDNVAFADGLVQAGKLLPAKKAEVVAVLDFAAGITEGDSVSFGDGDAKQTKTHLQILQDLFKDLPKQIEFAELGGGEAPGKTGGAIPTDLSKHI